jgi:2,3-bisphosphoglycerate-independent phosphoglycerate mutase
MATRTRPRPAVLCVLDGWGHRPDPKDNAILDARTPNYDRLIATCPQGLIDASETFVGLPKGQMGNSEVGHMNLGAGRVAVPELPRIDKAIETGALAKNKILIELIATLKKGGGACHLLGLASPGGVHSHQDHLVALANMIAGAGVPVWIHALLDGRDMPPRSAHECLEHIATHLKSGLPIKFATVGGRYYGMDRDKRWERIEKWYRVAVDGVGPAGTDPVEVIAQAYERNETDEFITPTVIVRDGEPVAPMRNGDSLICFNYRADRMRQIVRALTQSDFDGFDVSDRPKLFVATMTAYDRTVDLPVAFPPQSMANIVGEVVSAAGLKNLRTAETEKYAHVTYFFNGGIETPFPGEDRHLVASQKVATYDLAPEMSAPGITDVLCGAIEKREHDFILCNYANADMVGHTGVMPAVIHAVETVDKCLSRVMKSAEKANARLLITADHGNCEMMIDPETGGPHTAHTTNPVPFIVVDSADSRPLRSGGALCDVGPTILSMLGLEQPREMTGVDLRNLGQRT